MTGPRMQGHDDSPRKEQSDRVASHARRTSRARGGHARLETSGIVYPSLTVFAQKDSGPRFETCMRMLMR